MVLVRNRGCVPSSHSSPPSSSLNSLKRMNLWLVCDVRRLWTGIRLKEKERESVSKKWAHFSSWSLHIILADLQALKVFHLTLCHLPYFLRISYTGWCHTSNTFRHLVYYFVPLKSVDSGAGLLVLCVSLF